MTVKRDTLGFYYRSVPGLRYLSRGDFYREDIFTVLILYANHV